MLIYSVMPNVENIKDSNNTSRRSSRTKATPQRECQLKQEEVGKAKQKKQEQEIEKIKQQKQQKQQEEKVEGDKKRQKIFNRSKAKGQLKVIPTTPEGSLVTPIRTKHKGNGDGRHTSPYKLLFEFVRKISQGNYNTYDTQELIRVSLEKIGKVLNKDSTKKFSEALDIYKNSQNVKDRELEILEIEKQIVTTTRSIEALSKNQEYKDLVEENGKCLKTSKARLIEKQLENKKQYNLEILRIVHSLIQSINGLTYKSDIEFKSSNYKAEGRVVQGILEKFKKGEMANEEAGEILTSIVTLLDIPLKGTFVQKKQHYNPNEFTVDDLFRFMALHLFICKEVFEEVGNILSDKDSDNCKNFIQTYLYQSIIKSGWIKEVILECNLTSHQKIYCNRIDGIIQKLKKATTKEGIEKFNKDLNDQEIPPSTDEQFIALQKDFEKYFNLTNFVLQDNHKLKSLYIAKSSKVSKKLQFEDELGLESESEKAPNPSIINATTSRSGTNLVR